MDSQTGAVPQRMYAPSLDQLDQSIGFTITRRPRIASSQWDELVIYGWIRIETNDNMPTDLMNICLQCHRNNKSIKPEIQLVCCKQELQ